MNKLILLNADFSLLIGVPFGILIALIVIIGEIYWLHKFLKANNGKRTIAAVTAANLTSFLVGSFLFDHPLSLSMNIISMLILCTFISILVESLINYLFMPNFGFKKILIGTTLVNIVSNLFAGICIYYFLDRLLIHYPM